MNLKEQNILFFTRTMMPGGTENVILQLCEILKPHVNRIIVCSCGGDNVQKLTSMGIMHYTIPDIATRKTTQMLFILTKIRKIVYVENITIIHSHHRMAALYAQFVGEKNTIRLANAHNIFHDKKILTKAAYRNTKVIAVGKQVKYNLVAFYGLDTAQVTVIHNAIKSFRGEIVVVKEIKKAKEEGFAVIGNIGRLSEQKGMEYYIKAAADVYHQNHAVRFFIVGDGEDSDKLKALVNAKLPEGIMSFLGYRSDIQNVMSQMDFVVLSSLWEGLPLTPIEAFSVGKTVVATAVDGTPEIVINEKNGLLVEAKNVKMLSKAIQRMINDVEFCKRCELASTDTYNEKFSFETFSKRYLEYYKEMRK